MIKERFLIPHDQVLAQDVLAPRPSSSTRPESLPGGWQADDDDVTMNMMIMTLAS